MSLTLSVNEVVALTSAANVADGPSTQTFTQVEIADSNNPVKAWHLQAEHMSRMLTSKLSVQAQQMLHMATQIKIFCTDKNTFFQWFQTSGSSHMKHLEVYQNPMLPQHSLLSVEPLLQLSLSVST